MAALALAIFAALGVLEIIRSRMLVRVAALLHGETASPAFQVVWRLPLIRPMPKLRKPA